MPKPRIFISYARSSAASVERIALLKSALADAGFESLQDVQIMLGEAWEAKLEEWLVGCHGAVVFLSPEALASEWVAREVGILTERRRAEGSTRVRIIPVAVGGLRWRDVKKDAVDGRFLPLATIQGGTDVDPAEVVTGLQGLHDFIGLPIGLDRGRTTAPPTVLNALRASQEIVPFRHRERELDVIGKWIGGTERKSVWLLHGPGGVGKTRLGLEVIRRQNDAGWDAGFLRKDAANVSSLTRGPDPLLVVVDYAETRTKHVRELLQSVATYSKSDARPRVRVLLLARDRGDWWTRMATEQSDIELLIDQSPRPVGIGPLSASVHISSWQEAVQCLGRALGQPVPDALYHRPLEDSELMGIPLYSHMAALDHVLSGGAHAVRSSADLLQRILSHESRYWRDWLTDRGHPADEDTQEIIDRTVVTVALLGGARTPVAVRKIVEGHDGQYEWRPACWSMLRHLYPDGRGGVRPLEPDLLGEHAVDSVLRRTDGDILSVVMDGPDVRSAATNSLTVLTRLAARTHDSRWLEHALRGRMSRLVEPAVTVASSQGEPLGETLAVLFEQEGDQSLADRFHELLPPPGRTRALRRLAASVARLRRQLAPADDSARAAFLRAAAATELAQRLGEIGDVKEALAAIWDAVIALAGLVNQHEEAYAAHLANALGIQADLLSRNGQFQEAIDSGLSSVHFMQLLKPGQHEMAPLLGTRYNNLANAYASLGHHAAAADAAKQAVECFRHLALEGRYQGECARAFGNLGRHLVNAGDTTSGENCLRVAVALLRELARKDPDAFEPLLATNLDQLGKALKDQGIVDDAIEALREGVSVFRTVRRRSPTDFAVELAVSLTDLGSLVAASNTAREALTLGDESVALLSSAVDGGALEHRAELSRALHEFGRSLAKCGERQAAIEAAEKAIALRRILVAEGGLSHDKLALAHGSLGQIHRQFGNAADSAKSFEEGLAVILDTPTPPTEASRKLLRQLAASYASAVAASGGSLNERLVGRLEREFEDVQG